MRQGKEIYTKKYSEAMELHEKGLSPREISEKLGISFSAVYSWTKKGNKPKAGIAEEFTEYLEKNGPLPLLEIRKKFEKHSEIFLMAKQRKMPVARKKLTNNMGGYYIWYYLKGQEKELEKRMAAVIDKKKELHTRFLENLNIDGL